MFFEEEEEEIIFEDFEEVEEVDNNEGEDEETMEIKEIVPEVVSLQYFCLQTISDNLERFNAALTTTEDINFQRHLHYIRRVHTSFFLNNKLREDKGVLKKKYWNILLNEHMKELHLSKIEFKDWDDFIKKLDEVGHGIEKIHFDLGIAVEFEKAVVFVKKVLLKLQNIKMLHLYAYCDDTILESLPSSCAELEELSVIHSSITEKGLMSLCQKKNNGDEIHSLNLRVIDLSGITDINDGVSYLLKNMPSLELVVYSDLFFVLYGMYKHDVHKASEDKYNLTSFSIPFNLTRNYYPFLHDVLFILSKCCPHIKTLSVPIHIKSHLESISNLPELEDFSAFDISPTSDLDLNWFLEQKGRTLKQLKIQNFEVCAAILVESCPNLEGLTLQHPCFQLLDPNISFKQLRNLHKMCIKTISFNDNLMLQSIIKILNCSPKLEKLKFYNTEFSRDDEFTTKFTKFCENSSLHHLEFISCDHEISLLQTILLTCSSLKTLVLENCFEIDYNDVEDLYKMSKSLKKKVEIKWKDDRSDFTSIDSYDDMFEYNSEYDFLYEFDDDQYESVDYYDLYDLDYDSDDV
ncbi:uncharacterized protein NPIL_273561 [Nephila pilipes]|uniref:Uncharacterized protein n=1 Tax=Nephila pilipes TaxID=299642 RepID=A0A8X6PRZ0_NEPPI|nr:uncharacterized protein NPIL_273561 [Nephila pilipes]